VTRHRGVPITTAAKTLVDLAPGLAGKRMGRAFREAIRLKYTTAQRVLEAADRRHRHLHALATRYATLPYRRCRSDAEALALETLYDAGIELPHVNIKVAGEEADLTFLERKVIIEIDGPDYHRFKAEDARKTAIWRNAGFDVRRISSDAVYDAPAELIRLALRPPGYAQTA
jgi:very-short-patch-repair endonuclease